MKKLTVFGIFLLMSALFLGACGDKKKDETEGNDPSKDSVTNVTDDDGGSLNTGDGYGFDNFDLEIEVDGQEAIKAKYEIDKTLEAIYINTLTGVDLKDDEAMNELDKLFKKLMLTKDTSKKEATDEILQWYGLDNYSKFDLDVDFDDGNELDVEDTK